MSPYVVIVDFSHMFHRCYAIALSAPNNYDIIEATVYHLQGVLRTLEKTLQKNNIHEYDLVFAEDRPPDRKLSLLPSYRSNRTFNRDTQKQQVKAELKARKVRGHWCHSIGNEADDVIATLVGLAQAQGNFVIIVTGDRDLWQLIGDTVAVFHPKKNDFVKVDDVVEAFGVGPSHVALAKTLWGDYGDCVPNACPRTQKQLLPFLEQCDGSYTHFKEVVESNWQYLSKKCQERLLEGQSKCEVNWQLVKLDSNCRLVWD